jgi:predicted flavoprotein YhiN
MGFPSAAVAGVTAPAAIAAAVSAESKVFIVVSETSRPLADKIMILGAGKFNLRAEK